VNIDLAQHSPPLNALFFTQPARRRPHRAPQQGRW
jgi:hypothetical protein